MSSTTLQKTLQAVRKSRRLSQLELALRIGISQRHVSFVESGRAQPSREMLLAWLQELQAPLAMRNAVLQLAGFAPVYQRGEWGSAVLGPARAALSRLLQAHEPLPAMVMDAEWNVLQMNQGAQWLSCTLMPWIAPILANNPEQPINLLDAMLHPEGMFRHVTNLQEVAPSVLAHLREDASVMPNLLPRVDLLAAQFQQRLGKNILAPALSSMPRQMTPVLTTRFATPHGELAFFSMFSTFGTPQDITLASLRVEHIFAVDDHTQQVMTQRPAL